MALTLPLTESVGSLSQVLTKQYYGQTLYYQNSDAPLSLAHGLASGTVSIGYFGHQLRVRQCLPVCRQLCCIERGLR